MLLCSVVVLCCYVVLFCYVVVFVCCVCCLMLLRYVVMIVSCPVMLLFSSPILLLGRNIIKQGGLGANPPEQKMLNINDKNTCYVGICLCSSWCSCFCHYCSPSFSMFILSCFCLLLFQRHVVLVILKLFCL